MIDNYIESIRESSIANYEYILKTPEEVDEDYYNGYLEISIPSYVYIFIVLMGIASYLVINYIHMIKVKKVKMSEALKGRE